MFGSAILEVAIGLVFVYLIFSLVCSSITEWISRAFAMRSRTLYAGVRNFLGDDPTRTDQLAGKLADRIYEHPLIKGLYQSKGLLKKGDGTKGGPSNIPSRTMALALFDTILEAGGPESADSQGDGRPGGPGKEENLDINANGTSMALQREARRRLIELERKIKTNPDLPESLRKSLTRIIETARSETDRYDKALATARVATERWFDDAMDRVSGWYKRQTQLIVLGLALVVSFGFNVDTIAITNTLYRDDTVRQLLVAQAEARFAEARLVDGSDPEAPASGGGSEPTNNPVRIENLDIPLGWSAVDFPHCCLGWVVKFSGLLFTSLAVALGAPFWFDLLDRLVSLRGAGRSPQRSTSAPADNTTGTS